jgi:hypothetical protein
MMNRRFLCLAAALALVAGCATQPVPVSVADTLAQTPSLSTLHGLVIKSGLNDTLKGPGPFTVFAPNNDAFKAVPARTMDELAKDPARLKAGPDLPRGARAGHGCRGEKRSGQVRSGHESDTFTRWRLRHGGRRHGRDGRYQGHQRRRARRGSGAAAASPEMSWDPFSLSFLPHPIADWSYSAISLVASHRNLHALVERQPAPPAALGCGRDRGKRCPAHGAGPGRSRLVPQPRGGPDRRCVPAAAGRVKGLPDRLARGLGRPQQPRRRARAHGAAPGDRDRRQPGQPARGAGAGAGQPGLRRPVGHGGRHHGTAAVGPAAGGEPGDRPRRTLAAGRR